jgi:hypothetical protein
MEGSEGGLGRRGKSVQQPDDDLVLFGLLDPQLGDERRHVGVHPLCPRQAPLHWI